MKQNRVKMLTPPLYFFFAFALMLSLTVTAWAAAKVGITVTADSTALEKSTEDRTVTVTVAPAQTVTICDYGFSVELPQNWSISSISNNDANAPLTAADYNLSGGTVAWMTGDLESVSVSSFAEICICVPAGTPDGTYTIRITGLCADTDYASVSVIQNASATLTVTVGSGKTEKTEEAVQTEEREDTAQRESSTGAAEETGILFIDTEGHWAEEAIRFAAKQGLMDGVGGGKFNPDGKVTRAMLVTILYRMDGSPAVSGTCPFTDVRGGSWYADAVIWAEKNQIVSGVGDGRFAPDQPVTRQQMAVMLMHYCAYRGMDVSKRANLSSFDDFEDIASWAADAMGWVNAMGLISGRSATRIAPRGTATRGECAAILTRYCAKR